MRKCRTVYLGGKWKYIVRWCTRIVLNVIVWIASTSTHMGLQHRLSTQRFSAWMMEVCSPFTLYLFQPPLPASKWYQGSCILNKPWYQPSMSPFSNREKHWRVIRDTWLCSDTFICDMILIREKNSRSFSLMQVYYALRVPTWPC